MELLHESILVQPHLLLKELLVLTVVLSHLPHLIIVISPCKSLKPIRSQPSTGRIKLLSVVLRQLRAKGVDRDDERPSVGLESENLTHHIRSLAPDVQAEVVERFKVGLIQGVPDDLNIHLIKILLIDAGLKERCKGGVDQHCAVQLCRSAGNVDCLHLLKA